MLEPNGPLPPEIYWRRRALAIGALVVGLALVIWVAFTVLKGDGDDTKPDAAAGSTTSAAGKTTAASSGASAPSTSKAVAAAPTAPAAPAAAIAQCPDQSLAVKATVAQPTYRAGEQPVFGIVITNISSTICSRDMGSAAQVVSVQSLDGQRRLWSSTDCYPDGAPDVRTLNPGQQAAFTVTWSGSSSQPNCAGERVPVPAGAYTVVAQIGSIRSAPEPFNIS